MWREKWRRGDGSVWSCVMNITAGTCDTGAFSYCSSLYYLDSLNSEQVKGKCKVVPVLN